MTRLTRGLLALSILCAILMAHISSAYANLSITPTRIVFEERDRFASVTLINTGNEQTTYEMGWRFFDMQETGPAYKPADKSTTEFDLSKHVVFTPKRVTLIPGAKQKIRLALRRPEEVPEGDFRAHLSFRPVAEQNTVEENNGKKQKASAAISFNVGYTIPILLRNGDINLQVDIGDVQISRHPKTGKLRASVPVNRNGGPYSVLSRLHLYHSDETGKEELIGQISNAQIFPEINKRIFDVPLRKENISNGTLRVVVEHDDRKPENRFIYAERKFPLK